MPRAMRAVRRQRFRSDAPRRRSWRTDAWSFRTDTGARIFASGAKGCRGTVEDRTHAGLIRCSRTGGGHAADRTAPPRHRVARIAPTNGPYVYTTSSNSDPHIFSSAYIARASGLNRCTTMSPASTSTQSAPFEPSTCTRFSPASCSFSDRCSAIAVICRSARPVAITIRSQNDALPSRSSVTTFSALSSSRLPTITSCSRCNADGSAFRDRRGAATRGPAAIVFLRGVPGVLPAADNVGLAIFLRGAARCRAGENGFGNLAMTLLLCWRGSHWPKRRAAEHTGRPRRARQIRTTPQPTASAVLHRRADAPPDWPVRDDCSRSAAERRREYGERSPAIVASAA